MMQLTAGPLRGRVELPGDKSISHRVAMLGAIAQGPCELRNYNTGADCASTLSCLESLGAEVQRGAEIRLSPQPLREPQDPLDCGNSGSTIRMLTGLLAGRGVRAVLTGDASLLRRPMLRVAEPLRRMGAVIELHEDQYAPVLLREGVTHGIAYGMQVSSAQVKSAVLLAGLAFPETRVIEPVPSRDHTERLLAWLGVQFGVGTVPAFTYTVPGDPSSAAFLVTAALLRAGSDLTIGGLLVNPHRIAYLGLLQRSGAAIELLNERQVQGEPVADVRVRAGARLKPIRIQPEDVPSVIDEIPALSVLGASSGLEVRGASELRAKESDRIAVMVRNLREAGLEVEEYQDGYTVHPGELRPVTARTAGDHRIAMAFGAAGMEVDDPGCVRISFPEFPELMKALIG